MKIKATAANIITPPSLPRALILINADNNDAAANKENNQESFQTSLMQLFFEFPKHCKNMKRVRGAAKQIIVFDWKIMIWLENETE